MKEKIGILANAIMENEKDPEEVELYMDALNKGLDSFRKYFNAVFQDVKSEEIGRAQLNCGFLTTEEFQEMREQTDSTRRAIHDAAIVNCSKLNRMCKMFGVEPFCVESEDRTEIADFIGTFVYNIYQEGIGMATLDKAYDVANASLDEMSQFYKKKSAIINATSNRYSKKELEQLTQTGEIR